MRPARLLRACGSSSRRERFGHLHAGGQPVAAARCWPRPSLRQLDGAGAATASRHRDYGHHDTAHLLRVLHGLAIRSGGTRRDGRIPRFEALLVSLPLSRRRRCSPWSWGRRSSRVGLEARRQCGATSRGDDPELLPLSESLSREKLPAARQRRLRVADASREPHALLAQHQANAVRTIQLDPRSFLRAVFSSATRRVRPRALLLARAVSCGFRRRRTSRRRGRCARHGLDINLFAVCIPGRESWCRGAVRRMAYGASSRSRRVAQRRQLASFFRLPANCS